MQSTIINRHCFIKIPGGKAYCSKCGHVIMQDQRNMVKHAKECNFNKYDFIKIYTQRDERLKRVKSDYVLAWKPMGDKLGLVVYGPKLVLRPGFKDSYVGGRWEEIYKCVFDTKDKRIWENKNDSFNLEFWTRQEMDCLNLESSYEIINKHFHIPGFKDLRTFVEIYKGRGYHYEELLTDEEAKELLQQDFYNSDESHLLWYWVDNVDGYIDGDVVELKGKNALVLRLHVTLNKKKKRYSFLIGENYFFCNEELNVKELLRSRLMCRLEREGLEKFDKRYPGYVLFNFWDSPRDNLLIPLFAPIYDNNLELLCKSGCKVLASHFYTHNEFHSRMFTKGSDIKKWLGVPAKILCRVQEDAMKDSEVLGVLAGMYKVAPEYLQSGNITYALVEFLKDNVLAHAKGKRTAIDGFDEMNSKVRLRIARYLSEKQSGTRFESRDYRMYVDYMNMSRLNGEYLYGYTPEDLQRAHNVIMRRYSNALSGVQESIFMERVESEEYKSLETESGKETEFFQDSPYVIRAPRSVEEMVYESAQLHHCVQIYSRKVANGETKIYFLRDKTCVDIPFVTIEVYQNKIYQLKARYNKKASQKVQDFVKRWAFVKKLSIDYSDFN